MENLYWEWEFDKIRIGKWDLEKPWAGKWDLHPPPLQGPSLVTVATFRSDYAYKNEYE